MSEPTSHHIVVPRTARYYQLGEPTATIRDLWIVCHGFSQLARAFVEPFRNVAPTTALVVAPEALSRFYLDSRPAHTGSSPVGATWMTREDRETEITDTVSYLDALYGDRVEALAAHGRPRDQLRVHALGFSQGAAAVARWAARGGAVLDQLVIWGIGLPDDVDLRALAERRPRLAIDLVHGERDRWATPEIVAQAEAVLAATGLRYSIRNFHGGHVLSTAVLRDLFLGEFQTR